MAAAAVLEEEEDTAAAALHTDAVDLAAVVTVLHEEVATEADTAEVEVALPTDLTRARLH